MFFTFVPAFYLMLVLKRQIDCGKSWLAIARWRLHQLSGAMLGQAAVGDPYFF